MLVDNPIQITLQELRALAAEAKGKVNKLILHWTAGRYNQVFDDYHLSIGPEGQLYQTCQSLGDHKSHTFNRNTGAVGIALCCCLDAICGRTPKEMDFGPYPPTPLQLDSMARVVAVLCEALGLSISFDTVITHAEAAFMDGYGPGSSYPDIRWDLFVFRYPPLKEDLCYGGVTLRQMASWYAGLYRQREEARASSVPF